MGIDLKNIDCLDLLKSLPDYSVDLMLTDPPYATTACDWDKPINLAEMWPEWERVVKPNAIWIFTGSQPFTSEVILSRRGFFKCEWIWQKNRGSNFAVLKYQPMKDHENVLIFGRGSGLTYNPIMEERNGAGLERTKHKYSTTNTGKRDAMGGFEMKHANHNGNNEKRYPSSVQKFNCEVGDHPTQKPVDLFRYLIKTYSNEGETVFDGYAGSGTTAIACIKEKRNFIGSELNKEYYDKAMERIKNELAQPMLF